MSVTIQGVPETITRDAYKEAIRNLGLDPTQLIELRWEPNGIFVKLYALDEGGQRFLTGTADDRRAATHEVFIKVVDDVSESLR